MKKIIVQTLLFIIIFNSIFNILLGYKVNAAPTTNTTGAFTVTEEDLQSGEESGTAKGKDGASTDVDAANTQSTAPSIMGTLISIIGFVPMMLIQGLKIVVVEYGYMNLASGASKPSDDKNISTKFFTIQNIVFGNYYMLNANIFLDSKDALACNKNGGAVDADNPIDLIKKEVSQWYNILKLISLALGVLTLIYIGIRMAISTVASDQAKYKKMLIAWVQSIGLIIILPYIMAALNYLNEVLIDFAVVARDAIGGESFEIFVLESVNKRVLRGGGVELVAYSIAYIALMWAEFKFFMMYIKRFFAVAFLTVISPLISITYSIDKVGDGQAQAFSLWMQEYTVNMLIQPLQAILYLVFVYSANEISKAAPIVGIVFLLSLTRAEKIVKTIFNLRNLVSISTMKLIKGK